MELRSQPFLASRILSRRAWATGCIFNSNDPNVSILDVDRFLDTHADWPSQSRIQRKAEKRLSSTTPPDVILELFKTRDPVSGNGKLQLARAHFAKGNKDAAEIHLRDAWVNHTFSLKNERSILDNYANYLRPEDHIARVDHLLWRRSVTAARRVFSRLPSDERRKAEARAALLLAAKSGPALFDALPDNDRLDPGVLHAAVRYFRRSGEEPRAVQIAKLAPTSPEELRNASRWWDERQLLMRWGIREERFEDAYAMAAGHGLAPSTDFSEAEFNAGWIALRYLGAPDRAAVHFKALTASVESPISKARGFYWLGRAAEDENNKAKADDFYKRAAHHAYTYYGQLAAEKIGGDALNKLFTPIEKPTAQEIAAFNQRPLVKALRMLSDLNNIDHTFLVFSYHIDDQLESAGEYRSLAMLAEKQRAPHIAVRAGKVAVRRNAFSPDVSYPLVFVPEEASSFVPPEVILGLSRQESEFNPRAYSSAGARGMMQLIPSTAKLTARKEGLKYSRSALLDDPIYNMTIGSAHLSHLLERYNGSYIMTFAAYNAGPHRVTRWVEEFGDPRTDNVDPVDWVEKIPFSETRNYVQRVLENTQIYRARLNIEAIPGKLSRDLEQGGARKRAGNLPSVKTAGQLAPLPPRILQIANSLNLLPVGAVLPEERVAQNEETAAPTPEAATQPNVAKTKKRPTRTKRNNRNKPSKTKAKTNNNTLTEEEEEKPQPIKSSAPVPPSNIDAPLTVVEENTQPDEKVAADTSPTESKNEQADKLEDNADKVIFSEIPPAMAPIAITEKKIAAPTAPAVTTDPVIAPISSATSPVTGKCETYRSYIARVEKEEASAADLNAGMLAELKSGGGSC